MITIHIQAWRMWRPLPVSCPRKRCHNVEISWRNGAMRWRRWGVTTLWGFLGAEISFKGRKPQKKARERIGKGRVIIDIRYIGQILLDCSIMELVLTYAGLQCNIHLCSIPYWRIWKLHICMFTYIIYTNSRLCICKDMSLSNTYLIERYILYTYIPVEEKILQCRLFWVLEELLDQQASEQVSKMEAKPLWY